MIKTQRLWFEGIQRTTDVLKSFQKNSLVKVCITQKQVY